MSFLNHLQRTERALLKEEDRRKRLSKDIIRKPELKMMFYKDILSASYPNDPNVWDKVEMRRSALLKHGYFDQEGNVTEKGLDALIRRVVKIVRMKHTHQYKQIKICGR